MTRAIKKIYLSYLVLQSLATTHVEFIKNHSNKIQISSLLMIVTVYITFLYIFIAWNCQIIKNFLS